MRHVPTYLPTYPPTYDGRRVWLTPLGVETARCTSRRDTRGTASTVRLDVLFNAREGSFGPVTTWCFRRPRWRTGELMGWREGEEAHGNDGDYISGLVRSVLFAATV